MVSLALAVKTGEGGKMFGAITAADIYEKLVAAGGFDGAERGGGA